MNKRAKHWSYNAGERGRNWVRAYEDNPSGNIFVEFFERCAETGEMKRKRVSLRHRDREEAKRQADEIAAGFAQSVASDRSPVTLQELFDKYLREVTPTKSAEKRGHDQRCAKMFLGIFGRSRKAESLSVRDWQRFIVARREGRAGEATSRSPVRNRQIEYDLKWLLAVLNWATKAANREGRVLLEFNPLKGLPLPKERAPNRPVLDDLEYHRLLAIAEQIGWRFKVALVLAHETGHRIGSIRQLRWQDVDLVAGRIVWQAESDKLGFRHTTPLSTIAVEALRECQTIQSSIGGVWILPAPKRPSQPCSRHLLTKWWKRAERLAGLSPERGRGWHSLRRKFATELKDEPLKDLCQLGGWKDPQTVVKCYQTADEDRMRLAIENRQPLRRIGVI